MADDSARYPWAFDPKYITVHQLMAVNAHAAKPLPSAPHRLHLYDKVTLVEAAFAMPLVRPHADKMREPGIITNVEGCQPQYPNNFEVTFASGLVFYLPGRLLTIVKRAK